MNRWVFHNPVRLHFGDGTLNQIGQVLSGRSYLLVTHAGAAMQPWRTRIAELCGEPVLTLDHVAPNPTLESLRCLSAHMRQIGTLPRAIVALGGGSVIDSSKFLAAGRGRYESVLRYIEAGEPLTRPALPIIAVPTTAGTGSDLTRWATIWDLAGKRKLSLERVDLYPEVSLVDPLLTVTLPWSATLASGLDALSHALESIWNINANPVTRDFAVRAARDIMEALPRLHHNPGDDAARTQMALGSVRAGLAFSHTRTALAHNISYPVTLDHGVAHGIASSFSLPEVMTAAIGVDAACDAALTEIFGALDEASPKLRNFLNDLAVPTGPAAFGIAQKEWKAIVGEAFVGSRGRNFIGSANSFPWRTHMSVD